MKNPLQSLIIEPVCFALKKHDAKSTHLEKLAKIVFENSIMINRFKAENLVVQIKVKRPPARPTIVNILFFEKKDIFSGEEMIHKTLNKSVGILPDTTTRYFSFIDPISASEGAPFYCDAIGFECSDEMNVEIMVYGE